MQWALLIRVHFVLTWLHTDFRHDFTYSIEIMVVPKKNPKIGITSSWERTQEFPLTNNFPFSAAAEDLWPKGVLGLPWNCTITGIPCNLAIPHRETDVCHKAWGRCAKLTSPQNRSQIPWQAQWFWLGYTVTFLLGDPTGCLSFFSKLFYVH